MNYSFDILVFLVGGICLLLVQPVESGLTSSVTEAEQTSVGGGVKRTSGVGGSSGALFANGFDFLQLFTSVCKHPDASDVRGRRFEDRDNL